MCSFRLCGFNKNSGYVEKTQGRNYKMFSSFQRNLSLCKRALRSQKKTKKNQTKLFSFSFAFHFLPRTEIIVFFSVSFKHSSKVEATLLELFSPERKWRLPCVHVSVKKENKTKQKNPCELLPWLPAFGWLDSRLLFSNEFFPARSRATLKKRRKKERKKNLKGHVCPTNLEQAGAR